MALPSIRHFVLFGLLCWMMAIPISLTAKDLYSHAKVKTAQVQEELNATPIYEEQAAPLPSHLDWKGWFVVFVIFVAFVMMAWDVVPPHIAMCVSAVIFAIAGVVKPALFLNGF